MDAFYADFEPTKATRAIQEFVDAHLSNWYVRLSRRRFWKSDNSEDKLSAYQTLYTCLVTVAKLISPVAPFFAEQLYNDLNGITKQEEFESVHLASFPGLPCQPGKHAAGRTHANGAGYFIVGAVVT